MRGLCISVYVNLSLFLRVSIYILLCGLFCVCCTGVTQLRFLPNSVNLILAATGGKHSSPMNTRARTLTHTDSHTQRFTHVNLVNPFSRVVDVEDGLRIYDLRKTKHFLSLSQEKNESEKEKEEDFESEGNAYEEVRDIWSVRSTFSNWYAFALSENEEVQRNCDHVCICSHPPAALIHTHANTHTPPHTQGTHTHTHIHCLSVCYSSLSSVCV